MQSGFFEACYTVVGRGRRIIFFGKTTEKTHCKGNQQIKPTYLYALLDFQFKILEQTLIYTENPVVFRLPLSLQYSCILCRWLVYPTENTQVHRHPIKNPWGPSQLRHMRDLLLFFLLPIFPNILNDDIVPPQLVPNQPCVDCRWKKKRWKNAQQYYKKHVNF